jgi:cytochrome c5
LAPAERLDAEDPMSDNTNSHAADDAAHDGPHEGPIKTPKQLVAAVAASFLVPIFAIVLLVNYVDFGSKSGAGSDGMEPQAVAQRLQRVGSVEIRDASDVSALKTGEQVYQAVCTACHTAGVAGAPKLGDAAAWSPRIATGYEALLNSALKGKGAMGAQGGGDYSDLEVGRAVVYIANQGGAKFEVPQPPAAAASAPN